MRRSRVTEMAQRQPPPSLRTSTSSSDNNRPRNERSFKPSHRGSQSDPSNKKKLGTRIADLESQLGLAQEELKSLKTQIVSVEAVKTAPQDQIEDKKSIRLGAVPIDETSNDVQKETDVFEVPMEKVDPSPVQDEIKLKTVSTESPPAESDPENSLIVELASKNDEVNLLKANLEEKEKQLEAFREENESLKGQVDEKSVKISSAESKIDELNLRLEKVDRELQRSKISAVEMNEKLEAAEKAKEELEEEMKKLRVQTEQWRKAADAAASVLEINGRRVSERWGSIDKQYGNGFGPIGGYAGYVGSPGLIDDDDDDFGSGKRKGSGVRMFGDLWKKKGHK